MRAERWSVRRRRREMKGVEKRGALTWFVRVAALITIGMGKNRTAG